LLVLTTATKKMEWLRARQSSRFVTEMVLAVVFLHVIFMSWQGRKIIQAYELQYLSLCLPTSAGEQDSISPAALNATTQTLQQPLNTGQTLQQNQQYSDISQTLKQLFHSLQALEPAPQLNSTTITTVPFPSLITF